MYFKRMKIRIKGFLLLIDLYHSETTSNLYIMKIGSMLSHAFWTEWPLFFLIFKRELWLTQTARNRTGTGTGTGSGGVCSHHSHGEQENIMKMYYPVLHLVVQKVANSLVFIPCPFPVAVWTVLHNIFSWLRAMWISHYGTFTLHGNGTGTRTGKQDVMFTLHMDWEWDLEILCCNWILYKKTPGNRSATETRVGNPLQIFLVPFPTCSWCSMNRSAY